jgi:hypothetical protein
MTPCLANLVLVPILPLWEIVVIGCVLAFLAVSSYRGTGGRLKPRERGALLLLRLLAVAVLCLLLLEPATEETVPRRHAKRVVLVALDSSASMAEADAPGQVRRLDAAREALAGSGLLGEDGAAAGELRLFRFDEDAADLSPGALPSLEPTGPTTYFQTSLASALAALRPGENCVGLFLLTDGHDFEMVPVARTAQLARAKQTPICPVPFGRRALHPDLSVRLASTPPHLFVGQKARLQASVRLAGGGAMSARVELRREGALLRDRVVALDPEAEADVSFDVSEPDPGQYEYEIRVAPLDDERNLDNNSAFAFLNVTDAKIPVLLLEGEPHWDTTFLRRTLVRNERVRLTSVFAVGEGKAPQVLLSGSVDDPDAPGDLGTPGEDRPVAAPASDEDFLAYPLIILGRGAERVLPPGGPAALARAVEDGGATLVFARGRPGEATEFDELAPAPWSDGASGPVRLAGGRGGARLVPLEVLGTAPGGAESLPDLPLVDALESPKPLAAVEAVAEGSLAADGAPAFVHRRQGAGQVMAVAVGGLWKWSLNAKAEPENNVYDRFWNQLLLNLFASSGALPDDRPRLSVSTANLVVGERISFALHPGKAVVEAAPRLLLQLDGQPLVTVPLAQDAGGVLWRGSHVVEREGRYRGAIALGGEVQSCRFSALADRRETTETSPDLAYLSRLAELSGGRVVEPAALRETVAALSREAAAEADAPPLVRRRSLWDRAPVFYGLFLLLGLEWFMRRRWGLV